MCDEGGACAFVCVSIDCRSCSLTHTHVTLHMSNKKGVDYYALLFLFSYELFFLIPRTCELLVLLIVSLIIFSRTLLAAAAFAAAGCAFDKAQPQPRIVGGDNGG